MYINIYIFKIICTNKLMEKMKKKKKKKNIYIYIYIYIFFFKVINKFIYIYIYKFINNLSSYIFKVIYILNAFRY